MLRDDIRPVEMARADDDEASLNSAIDNLYSDDKQSPVKQYAELNWQLKAHQEGQEKGLLVQLSRIENDSGLVDAIKQRIADKALEPKDIPAILKLRKSQLEPLYNIKQLWYDYRAREVEAGENPKKARQIIADQIGENINTVKIRFKLHPFSKAGDEKTNLEVNAKLKRIADTIEKNYQNWCRSYGLTMKVGAREIGQSVRESEDSSLKQKAMMFGAVVGLTVAIVSFLLLVFCQPLAAIATWKIMAADALLIIAGAAVGHRIGKYCASRSDDLSRNNSSSELSASEDSLSNRPSLNPSLRNMAAKSAINGGHGSHQVVPEVKERADDRDKAPTPNAQVVSNTPRAKA